MAIGRVLSFAAAMWVALIALSEPLLSQSPDDDPGFGDDPVVLDVVTVTTTKTPESVYDALSGSSVVTRDVLDVMQPDSVSDVLQTMPGVTTQTSPDDPGVAVNVRGLQDFGRVNVMIDGARQNFQKSGHNANGAFYFDPEMLKSVDVTRGPSATVYGSGAIGGVVSFTTIDASDVLGDGERIAGRLKTGYETNGASPLVHGEAAAKLNEMVDIVGAATWRDAGEYEAGGGDEVPHSWQELSSGLAKARIRPAGGHEITLSALLLHNDFDNGLTDPLATTADTETYTLGYRWTPGSDWADLNAKVYYTGTDLEQTEEDEGGADATQSFAIATTGFDAFNTSRVDTGSLNHRLTYGGDAFRDKVETSDPSGSSEDLTPSGERLVYGAFIQDRIAYDSWLEVIAALRFDTYRLTGGDIENDGSRLSPRITVGVTPFVPLTFYATYAEGYRAPALTETLIEGFHPPPVSAGEFFPNPDLKPEVAHNIELGANLRFNGLVFPDDRLRVKLGAYHNRVTDYIEQVFQLFPIPGGYQYQNIAEAEIEGIEAEALYDAGRVFAIVSGQLLRGTNTRTGETLVTAPPNRLTGTLGFRFFEGAVETGTTLTVVGGKENAEANGYVGDPYELVDLFVTWRVNEKAKAGLFLSNVFDKNYTQYLNGSPSPGLSANVTLTVELGAN